MNATARTAVIGLMGAVALGSCGEERPHPPDHEIRTEPATTPSTQQPAIATDTSLPNIGVTASSAGGVDTRQPSPMGTEQPRPMAIEQPKPMATQQPTPMPIHQPAAMQPQTQQGMSPQQAQPVPIQP